MVLHSKKKNSRKSESRAGVPLPGQPFLLQLRSQPGDGGGRAGTGAGIAALGVVAWPLGLGALCIRARLLHVLLLFPQCYGRQMFIQESEMSLLWLGGGHQGYPARSWTPTVWLQTPSHQWGAPRWGVSLSSAPQAPLPRFVFPGDVLFQMAEVHRQIQNQLEEMVSAHRCCSTGAAPQPGLSNPLPAPPSPQI